MSRFSINVSEDSTQELDVLAKERRVELRAEIVTEASFVVRSAVTARFEDRRPIIEKREHNSLQHVSPF